MRPLLVALLLPLASCSLLDRGPSAADAADALATALSHGKPELTGVPDAQQWWDDLTSGLSEEPPAVAVEEVSEDGDTAEARLSYAWTLPSDQTWTYTATARLSKKADAWTVAAEPALVAPDLREGERLVARRVLPPRADILGAGDIPLVTPRPVLRIGIDKTKVADPAALPGSAQALATLLELDPTPYAEQVSKAGPKAFVQAIVLRAADVTPRIGRGVQGIPGAVTIDDELPLAPTRDFARPILGTVGDVTAEIVEKSGGFYRAGDLAGVSGLQSRYDERLRGTAGVTVSAVAGPDERELFKVDPQPGKPLRLTLDEGLQTSAESLLAGVRPASAVVAIRPSTGEILAAASGPGSNGLSTATTGQYAPGSTMKVVSSLALLRAGLKPSSPLDCPATTVVNGKQFKNYSDYPASGVGRIDLATAVANSCNTAFIGQRDTVPQQALADAAAVLGLGVDHDLGYPVFLGSVPATAGSETEHAASFIGQGKVLASPVAMASVAASVAAGRTVVPTLVSDAPAEQGASFTEAPALRDLMRGVVTRGSGAFLGDVPGAPVLAKTGTAEFGSADPPKTHAWMVAAQGDLAVAVFVEVGESGSKTAGPILEAFLRATAGG